MHKQVGEPKEISIIQIEFWGVSVLDIGTAYDASTIMDSSELLVIKRVGTVLKQKIHVITW